VQVRTARAADLDAMLELEAAFPPGDRFSRRTWRRLLAGRSACLVAVAEARVVGSASVLFRAGSGVARLYSLAVDAEARGRGVGGRLVAAAKAAAAGRGATRLRLEVRPGNAAAIGLYEAAGFRRIGERERYYSDGDAAIRMETTIKDEDA